MVRDIKVGTSVLFDGKPLGSGIQWRWGEGECRIAQVDIDILLLELGALREEARAALLGDLCAQAAAFCCYARRTHRPSSPLSIGFTVSCVQPMTFMMTVFGKAVV